MVTSFFCITNVSQAYGDENEVISRVSRAGDSLEAAYFSLLKSERAGGDPSGLVALLNRALELYSEAHRALESGDYETAALLVDDIDEITGEILEPGMGLMVASERFAAVRFRNKLFLSLGVVLFVILSGSLGWSWFKVYYVQRMMGLIPEVVADES